MTNKKSDVKAKEAFCEELLNTRHFVQAAVVSSPADIKAVDAEGQEWYFEIKMTKRQIGESYFGAATLTEWMQALKDSAHFRFVVAITDDAEDHFTFQEFTPHEFMQYSTIPPFKAYFNLPLMAHKADSTPRTPKKALQLTEDNLRQMAEMYAKMKKEQNK